MVARFYSSFYTGFSPIDLPLNMTTNISNLNQPSTYLVAIVIAFLLWKVAGQRNKNLPGIPVPVCTPDQVAWLITAPL